MTTIAYDGKTVSSDSLITRGDSILRSDAVKIIKENNIDSEYIAYAFCGETRYFNVMINWIREGAAKDNYPEPGCLFIAFRKDGDIEEYYEDLPFDTHCKPVSMAFGSGRDYASGALASGCTSDEAVRAAIRCDIYSGGSVLKIDLTQQ